MKFFTYKGETFVLPKKQSLRATKRRDSTLKTYTFYDYEPDSGAYFKFYHLPVEQFVHLLKNAKTAKDFSTRVSQQAHENDRKLKLYPEEMRSWVFDQVIADWNKVEEADFKILRQNDTHCVGVGGVYKLKKSSPKNEESQLENLTRVKGSEKTGGMPVFDCAGWEERKYRLIQTPSEEAEGASPGSSMPFYSAGAGAGAGAAEPDGPLSKKARRDGPALADSPSEEPSPALTASTETTVVSGASLSDAENDGGLGSALGDFDFGAVSFEDVNYGDVFNDGELEKVLESEGLQHDGLALCFCGAQTDETYTCTCDGLAFSV